MREATTDNRSAQTAPRRPLGRLATWFDHHLYSFMASLGRVARKPWATALTVGVMAVALALPLGLWLVLGNVSRFAGDVQQSREVSVFLKPAIDVARAQIVAQTLRDRGDVAGVELRTPAQGLAELRASGLDEAIQAAGGNPLPSLLIVTPKGDESLLASSLQQLPEADLVQHDAVWRQRLDGWLRFGTRVALVLAALLGLGALLVADEPTGNLDPTLSAEIMALFSSLPERGTSVLVASHDLGLVKRMKRRVLVLDHGQLVDDIAPEDLADA
jgi:cell division transport system permease protein